MLAMFHTIALAAAVAGVPLKGVESRAQIEKALADSADGWNNRNLSQYMAVYAQDRSTLYVTNGKVVQGFDDIERVYASRFKTGNMGHLSVEVIDFRMLGSRAAWILGRYHLMLQNGGEHTGLTTLIFQRVSGEWRLVLDHTA